MTRARLTTAALVAAVVVLVVASLPPRPRAPSDSQVDNAVPGVLHVHTNRSDGRSSPDEIAAIAARVGLQFIVFTDHGDATRKPDLPAYRSGVLCLDAVEISTNDGHLVVLGLPAVPYPLTGDARDVIEDVHRLGGIAIAAHPDSPKTDLRWRDWSVPVDGIEFMNLDTMGRFTLQTPGWRGRAGALATLVSYFFRGPETIGGLPSDTTELSAQWARSSAIRRTLLLAGADAHARLEIRDAQPGDNRGTIPFPGYETVFRAMTTRVDLAQKLTGNAADDARLLLESLRQGRAYTATDAILGPPSFAFSATVGARELHQGDESSDPGPVTLAVRTNAPASFTTTIWRNDAVLRAVPAAPELRLEAPEGPAAYRVEIRATDRRSAPLWLVSNGIYVRTPNAPPAPAVIRPLERAAGRVLFDAQNSGAWRTEASPASLAALDVTRTIDGRALLLRFGLPGGAAFGEYAAAVVAVDNGLEQYRQLSVTGHGEHPMRVSVQLRVEAPGREADRWERSVYLDSEDRSSVVDFSDFRPVGVPQSPQLDLANVRTILFLLDRGNTKPGSSGRLWLSRVALQE